MGIHDWSQGSCDNKQAQTKKLVLLNSPLKKCRNIGVNVDTTDAQQLTFLQPSVLRRAPFASAQTQKMRFTTPPLLTLNKIQLRQEFQLSGDVQLEMSERRVGIQGEILEILDRFVQPGASKGREKRLLKQKCADLPLKTAEFLPPNSRSLWFSSHFPSQSLWIPHFDHRICTRSLQSGSNTDFLAIVNDHTTAE